MIKNKNFLKLTKNNLISEIKEKEKHFNKINKLNIKYQSMERDLLKKTQALSERVKELNCLYSISKLTVKKNISFDELIKKIISVIPNAWQYPEITSVRLIIEDKIYKTDNFKETNWKQISNITVNNKHVGTLGVYYIEQKTDIQEGPFLKEERHLLNLITEELCRIIEHKQANEELKESHSKLKKSYNKLKMTQQQLIKSEKLASIGQIAGKVAHEVNNPLASIKSRIQIIKNDFIEEGHNDIYIKDLTMIEGQIDRIELIVRNLLEFSRIKIKMISKLNINEILNNIIQLKKYNLKIQGIVINKYMHKNLPEINIDTEGIQQVFINIIKNARESMPEGGKLIIKTQLNNDKKFIQVLFKDTGHGIKKEYLDKIYDPFFTTKKTGTGLGLSICKSIIEQHNGAVKIISIPNKGTTIMISLPV